MAGARRARTSTALLSLAVACLASAQEKPPPTSIPQQLNQGTWLIAGGILPDREPDGNSVVFIAPAGFIVLDTGRHVWHRDSILEFARDRHRPIIAVINSHWHLDHVSGNAAVRLAYPGVRVYASDAINHALTGFLATSAADEAPYVDDPTIPDGMRADIRADLLTIQNGAALMPDQYITGSQSMTFGGRTLNVNLARFAATSGDVWLYDPRRKLAAVGDLVTLPAPFLDTACPAGWKSALAQISATPFRVAVPGHGAPMNRLQFSQYRHAFDSFIACSNSTRSKDECATGWTHEVQSLLGSDPLEPKRATASAAYYIDLLRAQGGRSKYCEAPGSAVQSG